VLATAIAETSLTIAGIRVVVDAGRARRARYDPGSGMTRLVTEPVSRAEAEQRRGRAGRVAPGTCYRLWARAQEGALPAHPPAEIEAADLAGLALELALWGSDRLPFLTPPPEGALAEARALLTGLGALDAGGRITATARRWPALPVHPRLAHMLLTAGRGAAPLAALLAARDPLVGAPADLTLRLKAIAGERSAHPLRREALEVIRTEARGWNASPPPMPGCRRPRRRRSPIPTGSAAAARARRRASCSPAARARSLPPTTRWGRRAGSSPPTSTATRARRASARPCR
jgi:ATP-dependent helicase HrpB